MVLTLVYPVSATVSGIHRNNDRSHGFYGMYIEQINWKNIDRWSPLAGSGKLVCLIQQGKL